MPPRPQVEDGRANLQNTTCPDLSGKDHQRKYEPKLPELVIKCKIWWILVI